MAFICVICDEKFERNDDKEEHEKIHNGALNDDVSIEIQNRIIFGIIGFHFNVLCSPSILMAFIIAKTCDIFCISIINPNFV